MKFHHVVIMHNLKDMEVENSFQCNAMTYNYKELLLVFLCFCYIVIYIFIDIFISITFKYFLMSYLNNRRIADTTDLLTK